MKKLTLDIDNLSVQSFETDGLDDSRGTVQGMATISGGWPLCNTNCSCPNTE
jgi:hypothetical protein